MHTMERELGHLTGYSDHTEGLEITLASVALGARVIEKHFTLDRLPGPDHAASLEPDELKQLVESIRNVEKSMGTGEKKPSAGEANTAAVARKSLVAARAIAAGEVITVKDIAVKRPGSGLPPRAIGQLTGKQAAVDIAPGTLFRLDMVR